MAQVSALTHPSYTLLLAGITISPLSPFRKSGIHPWARGGGEGGGGRGGSWEGGGEGGGGEGRGGEGIEWAGADLGGLS